MKLVNGYLIDDDGVVLGRPGSLDEFGRELLDPTPLSVPAGFRRPETLAEQVRRLVQHASADAARDGDDTFEESLDFDISDDDSFDPSTPFEEFYDPSLGFNVTPELVARFDAQFRDIAIKVNKQRLAQADFEADLQENRGRRGEARQEARQAPEHRLGGDLPESGKSSS